MDADLNRQLFVHGSFRSKHTAAWEVKEHPFYKKRFAFTWVCVTQSKPSSASGGELAPGPFKLSLNRKASQS